MAEQAAAKKASPTKVVTEEVRLSYIYAHTPRADEENPDRLTYSVTCLIPKTDTVTIAKINAAIEAVKADPKSAAIWGSKWLASFKSPLRDGDTEKDTEKSPEYKGNYFVNCNSVTKPGVVGKERDIEGKLIPLGESEVYSGGYGKVSINFYAFNKRSQGIAAGLGNIQWLRDGERLAGRASADDDFGGPEADDNFLG